MWESIQASFNKSELDISRWGNARKIQYERYVDPIIAEFIDLVIAADWA